MQPCEARGLAASSRAILGQYAIPFLSWWVERIGQGVRLLVVSSLLTAGL